MLETLLKLYVMATRGDVRSPMPHIIGPPGCGKSTTVEQLADLVGVQLHLINVSRLSPLEVEGVQMPHLTGEELVLKLLPAPFWTRLKAGDIILFDEFLRGFPEVYNGLLDILTSRRAGAYVLPPVFIIGASNSNVSYDPALEDRLLHIPVGDPRKSTAEFKRLARILVDALGIHPDMADSLEMTHLLQSEVLPTFNVLDQFTKKGTKSGGPVGGQSLRKIIGQARLRQSQTAALNELITMNNVRALREGKPQFVLLLDGKNADGYLAKAAKLYVDRLTPIQALNLELNKQLIELEEMRTAQEGSDSIADEDTELFA